MTQGKDGKGPKPLSWQTCLEAGVTHEKCSQECFRETERQKRVLKLHSESYRSLPLSFENKKLQTLEVREHYRSISPSNIITQQTLFGLNKTETYSIKKDF